MLNVAHDKNYVKWRPIVTKFGTLIENMRGCMTVIFFRFLLTILWELVILVWEFYMLKSNIDVFFVTSFLCSPQFLLFYRIEYPKGCLWKKIEIFLWLSFCDMTVPSKCNAPSLWPWSLTYEGQFLFRELSTTLISILCKFQIDISSNSWEIKYQNIGRTHTQTHTHTDTQTDRPGENNTSQPPPGAR